jgi:hypothetical protein
MIRVIRPPDVSDLSVDFGGAFGTRVPLDLRSASTLKAGDLEVKPVSAMLVKYPERVRFSAAYRSGKSQPEFVLSIISYETLQTLMWTTFIAAGFVALGFVAAIVSAIIILVKRKRSRIQLIMQYAKIKKPESPAV